MYKYEVKELLKKSVMKLRAKFDKELAKRDDRIDFLERQIEDIYSQLDNLDPHRY